MCWTGHVELENEKLWGTTPRVVEVVVGKECGDFKFLKGCNFFSEWYQVCKIYRLKTKFTIFMHHQHHRPILCSLRRKISIMYISLYKCLLFSSFCKQENEMKNEHSKQKTRREKRWRSKRRRINDTYARMYAYEEARSRETVIKKR